LGERAWGTVREDYSEHGQAWEYFPHDHARSRAYRWSEDGLGGVCDDAQTLCLAFAFWNGRDPILKERIFGLTGNEGNHGEDAKEYWAYLDSTPTHSWMRWRYLYPQVEFPYGDLVATNRQRGRGEPEYELVDTGVFDEDRYWEVTADYAKAAPDDLCIRLRVRNAGPDEATIDVLPTLWFRNTWSWGLDDRRPSITAKDGRLVAEHHALGRMALAGDGKPELLCCENESNKVRLWGIDGSTRYPKDGIADYVLYGAGRVNPDGTGTKAALRYRLSVPGGGSVEVRLRLAGDEVDTGGSWERVLTARAVEADAFYAELIPAGATADEAAVCRQAFAGMLWSKQFFHCDVDRWLEGDPAGPPPPAGRKLGRNAGWRHLNNHDVISMPDKWEYPWYAAWDLAFHAVALAHVDPGFAKDQLVLMCREWYMHPNGQLPAYEWAFGDVNPPVHAWAALRVFEIDGCSDYEFLERVLHKLLLNFTWWVNRKDAEDSNVFEGGFLGLDNIGPIDRSAPLPVEARLEQSDGTAWMAMYCLNLFEIALVLAEHDHAYEDLATKFFEHFAYIAAAMGGLWDEQDSFYYDVLRCAGGGRQPLRVRSLVGLLPLCATTALGQSTLTRCAEFAGHMRWFLANKPQYAKNIDRTHRLGEHEGRLLAVVDPELRLRPILAVMLDEAEFLSRHGLRSVAASHRERPFTIEFAGVTASVDYEPGESTTGLFGGNSNWRGPVWFPVNYLLVEALGRFARYYGDDFTVEHPTGSGRELTLAEVADDLAGRLIGIFLDDERGRRPVFGGYEKFQTDPAWHDLIPFHEYFHGDTGAGLGASHQTGWTGLVADLIMRRRQ
ncbi:MAG: MGH1-like glycoside hydrolase domain-containing protein, partial [Egibacteraceae bacterium]